jgi:hypothetical protein
MKERNKFFTISANPGIFAHGSLERKRINLFIRNIFRTLVKIIDMSHVQVSRNSYSLQVYNWPHVIGLNASDD